MAGLRSDEVSRGQRFEFGANWRDFLDTLNDERIHEAERSLKEMLSVADLSGKRFLDIGSGSGLFSLAAYLHRRISGQTSGCGWCPLGRKPWSDCSIARRPMWHHERMGKAHNKSRDPLNSRVLE